MSIRDILITMLLGAFGGIVRTAIVRKGFTSLSLFFIESIIGMFMGFVTGIFLNNYSKLNQEVIFAICAFAGVMARDLLPILMKTTKRRFVKELEEK